MTRHTDQLITDSLKLSLVKENCTKIQWSAFTGNLNTEFKALPSKERALIIHTMIMYKSCYGTPTGRSEKGLFQVVAGKHILNRSNQTL